MPQPLPNKNANLWDYVIIEGNDKETFKLLADYDGTRNTKVDSQLVASGSGGEQQALRRNPAKFNLTIKVVTEEHMATYEKALAFCLSRGNAVKMVTIHHPAFAQLDVQNLFVESVTPLKVSGVGGMLTSKWSLTEKRPTVPKNSKKIDPNTSKPTIGNGINQSNPSQNASVWQDPNGPPQ